MNRINPLFKNITLRKFHLFKVIAVAIMVTLLLLTSGIADQMSYRIYNSNPDNALFSARVSPSLDNYSISQDLAVDLSSSNYTSSALIIYQDLMEGIALSSSGNLSTNNNMLVVGLSIIAKDEEWLGDNVVAITQSTSKLYGLRIGDEIKVSTAVQTVNLTVGAILELTTWTIDHMKTALATWGAPSDYFPIITTISNARYISQLFPSVSRLDTLSDWLTVYLNMSVPSSVGTYEALKSAIDTRVSGIYEILNKYGTVEIEYTPRDRIERLYSVYIQLEREVSIIVLPTIAVSAIFLYVIVYIDLERQRRSLGILLTRGASWSQIRLLTGIRDTLIGLTGGLLSVFFSIALSGVIFKSTGEVSFSAVSDLSILWSSIPAAIIWGIVLIVPSSMFSIGTLREDTIRHQLARNTSDESYKSRVLLMVIIVVVSLLMFYEMSHNFSLIQVIIASAGDSPTLIALSKILIYLEIALAMIAPLLLAYAVAHLAPLWHARAWESSANRLPITRLGGSLLAKTLALKPRRSYYLAVLFILSVFLATFLGTYSATRHSVATTDTQLRVGGDISVQLSGNDLHIDELISLIESQPGVATISNCSSTYIGLNTTDGYFTSGMLYMIDDNYGNLTGPRVLSVDWINATQNGILVGSSLVDEFRLSTEMLLNPGSHSEIVRVTIPRGISFAPGFQKSMDDFQRSDYLMAVTSKSYLSRLNVSSTVIEHPDNADFQIYLFIETSGDVNHLAAVIDQWIEKESLLGQSIDYDIETSTNGKETSLIEDTFVGACAGYLTMAGLLAVLLNVAIVLDERRYQLLVIRSRGATFRQMVGGLVLYYTALAIPLVFLGTLMSILYTYAAVFAPILLTHSIYSSTQLLLPVGYQVITPLSVILADSGMLLLSILLISVIVKRTLKQTRVDMEED